MLFDYQKKLEPRNYVDGVDFSANDPCIWNVYPPGASGDLLASIINAHYGRTGSDYFGINENGQVIFRPSDYKITNIRDQQKKPLFDDQHFYDIADALSSRNINYSMCDQFIFSCHLHRDRQIRVLLNKFPRCKILRTYPVDLHGVEIMNFMSQLKNVGLLVDPKLGQNEILDNKLICHPNVLNIPFGGLFNKQSYHKWYDLIIKFLDLNGRLICFEYIKYYLSKQHPKIKNILISYGHQL